MSPRSLPTTEALWRALSRRERPFLIAGPCVIESPTHPQRLAARLQAITDALGIDFVFKASYDKANRSSLGSYRGPGLERGLLAADPAQVPGQHLDAFDV